nr:PREDICTED: gallinacin-14-like [Struthio camelus australis]
MRTLFLLLALLLVVSQAAAVSDTVMFWEIRSECSFLMCPFFKGATSTCYGRLAKCCRLIW